MPRLSGAEGSEIIYQALSIQAIAERWLKEMTRKPQEVAMEEFLAIFDSHPAPLPDDVLRELDRILSAAHRTADSLEN
jgi:hypothetical protein